MIATLDRIDSTTKKFSTEFIESINTRPSDLKSEMKNTAAYILSDKWMERRRNEETKDATFDKKNDREELEKVCQSLFFRDIGNREAAIPEKHAATFEWIFRDPPMSDLGVPLWSHFPSWLQTDADNLYWIRGKPGAGKSTLLKFITNDPRFENLLRAWADGHPLLVARFFAWTAGSDLLQKSHEGLLRTLLLDVLHQKPELVVKVFPGRWLLAQSLKGDLSVHLPAPQIGELLAAFRALLSAVNDELKLAIVIDGLDEFDEKDRSHSKLIELLREAKTNTAVKLCVSSRPWNIFKDEYLGCPTLQLENLTKGDIMLFVEGRLGHSQGYQEFAHTSPQNARKIVMDLVDKSQGVFLWVSVIASMLETRFREGTSMKEIQAEIDQLPSEVYDLFRYIWLRTSPRFRAEASQYFRIKRLCQSYRMKLYALTLWFGDPDIPTNISTDEVTDKYLVGAIKSLERKLMSRTGGLLELTNVADDVGHMTVDFMHRTANDWTTENWASIVSATDAEFSPELWILKGEAISKLVYEKKQNLSGRGFEFLLPADPIQLMRITSRIPGGHPDSDIVVDAIDRLMTVEAVDRWLKGFYADYSGYSLQVLGKTKHNPRIAADREALASISPLPAAASFCVEAYIRGRIDRDANSDPFESSEDYSKVLYNLVFGEVRESNKKRIDLVKLLTQDRYRHWFDGLKSTQAAVTQALGKFTSANTDAPIFGYLKEVEAVFDGLCLPEADTFGKVNVVQGIPEPLSRIQSQGLSPNPEELHGMEKAAEPSEVGSCTPHPESLRRAKEAAKGLSPTESHSTPLAGSTAQIPAPKSKSKSSFWKFWTRERR